MAASSGSVPDVLPSQVLSVSPSLPTNKLLDNLTKNQRLLQSLPQNYEKRHFFTGLYKTLLDDFFYSHERADIQLYTAICLADIIRIYAPNLPEVPQEKMLNMFLFLARQLLGLKKIDDPLFTRRYYLLENLSMVQSFIPAVNLEDNRGCQISTVVLTNLFNAVQKKHTDQLKNLIIDIISVILAEYETIPFSLLELLFARIIDPEKKLREECYELVESIIRRGESFLKSAIADYFKAVLVTEDTDSLHLHPKIYYIFDELCHISEAIVDEIIPSIEHRLQVPNEKHRRDAAKIIAYVTSAPNNDFAQRYKSLWNIFLDQFKNGTPEVQLSCVKHLKSYFVNHPELRTDLENVMVHLSLSTDTNIRSQLMVQIRATTNYSLFDISDKIKQILCERARDKIWEVRKEALDYLAQVYKKECTAANWSDDVQKQLTWVANCIIHLYYQKTTQDKLLAERLLTFYLMPWDVKTDNKVRVLFTLYSNVSENAQRAVREIIHSKFLFRRQLDKMIDFCLQMADLKKTNDEKQTIELKLVSLIHTIALRCLPNPEKNESVLKAFAIYAIKNHKQSLTNTNESSILSIFKQAIADGIKSKECYALANGMGQMLLEEAAKEQKRFPTNTTDEQTATTTTTENSAHGQFTKMCGLIKTIFEKISTLLFDQETVSHLLKFLFERVSNEPEQPASYYENINQLLKVFIQHPFIFNSPQSLELLCNLLKQHVLELAPILIRTIEACAPLIISSNQTDMLTLLDSELSSYLTLHPPIAKRALYCMCALHPNKKDELLQKLVDDTQYDQFDSDQFITRLVLLGHMIQISPTAVGDIGKRILNNISKYIIDKQNNSDQDDENNMTSSFLHGHFTLLADEPHSDPEIGADTRVMRELIKAMTRATLGLRENSSSLFTITYKFIRKCIEKDQDFTGDMSESEIIYIRLCGLTCLLKLICNPYFYTRIKPDDFLMIMTLLRDPSSQIRQRTYRKLAEHLRDPVCPIELLALLAFAAKEPEPEHREQIRRLMLQIIDTRREHIKLQLSYKTAQTSNGHQSNNGFDHSDDNEDDENSSSTTDEKPIDYTLYPEYSLTYFLFFLSKSPAFILYDDIEMLHTMADYILFLLDALLLRCDTTVGLFYKGLLRSIKSAEDATISPDKEEKAERKDALKKLHVLVDLAYVILSQRASSLMICRASSNVPLPEMYFKKIRYNHVSYLPKDFKIKLKPITTTTTVSDTPTSTVKRATTTETASSITIETTPAKAGRRKQDNEQQSSTKKRKASPSTKKRKRQTSNNVEEEEEDDDEDTNSNSPPVNGNKTRKTPVINSNRARVNYPYEKPKLRSASSSSSSPSPKSNRRAKGKL
ncbi:unnamed protein product [Adineta ricciae]|uniref:Uncharacterized protein n=1 Tax=Adineta ricciae TaxID=249248 RepID=A0A814HKN4_ADIRI|nr:unnamed protein product [Adineta ricciae]